MKDSKLKIKIFYREDLDMPDEVISEQCGRIAYKLVTHRDEKQWIVDTVGVSDEKYKELTLHYQNNVYDWYQELHRISGILTVTAFGVIENE